MSGVIWWEAYSATHVGCFDVNAAWADEWDEPDVSWLGECAWTARADNTALGLR